MKRLKCWEWSRLHRASRHPPRSLSHTYYVDFITCKLQPGQPMDFLHFRSGQIFLIRSWRVNGLPASLQWPLLFVHYTLLKCSTCYGSDSNMSTVNTANWNTKCWNSCLNALLLAPTVCLSVLRHFLYHKKMATVLLYLQMITQNMPQWRIARYSTPRESKVAGRGAAMWLGVRGLSRRQGVTLVCPCGRFGRSGAFIQGTGNRWWWEIKLLSAAPLVCPRSPSLCPSSVSCLRFLNCVTILLFIRWV